MVSYDGSSLLRLLCIAFAFFAVCHGQGPGVYNDGSKWKPQWDEPVKPLPAGFPYPLSNETYFGNCTHRDDSTKETSIYSIKGCHEPLVTVLKSGESNFFVGSDVKRNISVAFKFDKMQGWEPGAMVHYVFGDCDVTLYIRPDDNKVLYDYAVSEHPSAGPIAKDFAKRSKEEQQLSGAIAVGPDGITLTEHTTTRICYRRCNPLNPDGTINFTQVVVGNLNPAIKLTYLGLYSATKNKTDIFVDHNGKDMKPSVKIMPGSPMDKPTVKTERGEVNETLLTTPMPPTTTTTEASGLPGWAIGVIIGVAALVFLGILGGLVALLAFLLCKKAAAAGGTGVATQSIMGTVTTQSQMTTAGTTVGDEQINVVVQK